MLTKFHMGKNIIQGLYDSANVVQRKYLVDKNFDRIKHGQDILNFVKNVPKKGCVILEKF
jgi:hypothetical protein